LRVKKASLNKVAETIVGTEFTTMYELPSDYIFIHKLNPISLRYQIYGSRIYTNYSATLYVDYIYNAPEDQWTAGFEDLIVSRLAMDLAPAIRDSATSMQLNAAQYEIASRMRELVTQCNRLYNRFDLIRLSPLGSNG
jgi:hypothetical protein